MKTKSLMIAIALFALVMGMTASAYAVTITPIASSSETGTPAITSVLPSGTFYLLVKVSDAQGLAGAALTITYDATKFEVVGADSSGLLDYSDIKTDVFTLIAPTTGTGDYPWLGNNTTGKLMLSGAYINTTTDPKGGGVVASGAKNIFKIKFKAKSSATGSGSFTLTESKPTAGGWDGNTPVPALIGAVNKDHADYNNLTSVNNVTPAFPAIAYTFASNPISISVGYPTPGVAGSGDMDGDSQVSIDDVKIAFQLFLIGSGTPQQLAAGNLSNDSDGGTSFSINDVKMIFRKFLGL